MKRLIGISLGVLMLGGCATSEHIAPKCSGKHRRPMNIYPSILPNTQAPAIAAGSTAAPLPVAVTAASAASDQAAPMAGEVFPSCE